MSSTDLHPLHLEWQLLQRQHEDYERQSIWLKTISVLLVASLMFHSRMDGLLPFLVLSLWGMEAIWKTFQSRIAQRLVVVEQAMREERSAEAMQLYTQWLANRGSLFKLCMEYVGSALMPTVLFPHFFLIALSAYLVF